MSTRILFVLFFTISIFNISADDNIFTDKDFVEIAQFFEKDGESAGICQIS